MQHSASSAPAGPRRRRRWQIVSATALLSIVGVIVAFVVGTGGVGAIPAPPIPFVPVSPSAADGVIAEGEVVSLDDDVPAVARLAPALRDALRAAGADAAADGLRFEITSGWRSDQYQRRLFEDATRLYASEEIARQYVATPERSRHVTGDAVDLGPVDAQFWLIEHGSRYGICQTYANERWHFELATDPGGVCPPMKTDAAG